MNTVTLPELVGLPARLTLLSVSDRPGFTPPLRFHGMITNVSAELMIVDLITAPASSLKGMRLGIEVLHPDGLLQFQTAVESVQPTGVTVNAPSPADLQWIQRRQKVRTPIQTGCLLFPVSPLSQAGPWEATTSNLSAGGIAVSTTAPLSPGDHVLIRFAAGTGLPEKAFEAEVLRIDKRAGGSRDLALRFVSLASHDEALICHVVEGINQERNTGHSKFQNSDHS